MKKHLRFWWPGKKYLKEFSEATNGHRRRWDRPTEELLNALNNHGNVSKAAKALGTTPMTLAKAIERHGITQVWVGKGKP